MSQTRVLWALAVVLAVVVVGMAYVGRRSDGETSTVVVAKQLIPAGTLVKPRMYDLQTVPQDEVAAGTLIDLRVLAMQYVAHPIYPGERFTTSDFSPKGVGLGHTTAGVIVLAIAGAAWFVLAFALGGAW